MASVRESLVENALSCESFDNNVCMNFLGDSVLVRESLGRVFTAHSCFPCSSNCEGIAVRRSFDKGN